MLQLKFLAKLAPFGLLVMRLGLGFIFIVHGSEKLFAGPTMWSGLGGTMGYIGVSAYPAFWGFMAGFTEFAGGILFVLGFLFRPAALFLTFVMAMAVMHHLHAADSFKVYSHPLSLGIVFLGLLFVGPGRYSIDGE